MFSHENPFYCITLLENKTSVNLTCIRAGDFELESMQLQFPNLSCVGLLFVCILSFD